MVYSKRQVILEAMELPQAFDAMFSSSNYTLSIKKNRTEASHGSFRFVVNEKKLVFVRILTSKQRMRASWIIILIIK